MTLKGKKKKAFFVGCSWVLILWDDLPKGSKLLSHHAEIVFFNSPFPFPHIYFKLKLAVGDSKSI